MIDLTPFEGHTLKDIPKSYEAVGPVIVVQCAHSNANLALLNAAPALLEEVQSLRNQFAACDEILKKLPWHGQEELAETSLASALANYRDAVEAELAADLSVVPAMQEEVKMLRRIINKMRTYRRNCLTEAEYGIAQQCREEADNDNA